MHETSTPRSLRHLVAVRTLLRRRLPSALAPAFRMDDRLGVLVEIHLSPRATLLVGVADTDWWWRVRNQGVFGVALSPQTRLGSLHAEDLADEISTITRTELEHHLRGVLGAAIPASDDLGVVEEALQRLLELERSS